MSNIKSKLVNDVVVVEFTDIKIIHDPQIREIGRDLERVVEGRESDKLLISFQGVQFMGSAMIGSLISLKIKCDDQGIDLRFCDINRNIMQAIKLLKLNERWTIYDNETKAIRAFGN